MKLIAAVLLVVAAGYPVAFVLTRRVLFAALIAPLVTGVTASLAVIAMLITRGNLQIWLTILLVAQFALAAWQLRRRGAPMRYATWRPVWTPPPEWFRERHL